MYRYLILFVFAGIIGSIIAHKKGHNAVVWFILCTIIPFLVFVILILPSQVAKGRTKKCPFCAEIIKEDAIVCKHCGNGVSYIK